MKSGGFSRKKRGAQEILYDEAQHFDFISGFARRKVRKERAAKGEMKDFSVLTNDIRLNLWEQKIYIMTPETTPRSSRVAAKGEATPGKTGAAETAPRTRDAPAPIEPGR